jgi:hypothetical protein
MPRRSILSATEQASLLDLPDSQDDLIRYYTFNEPDLSLIRQRRGDANRLGFAIQLCLLRYPGYALTSGMTIAEPASNGSPDKFGLMRTHGGSTVSAMRRGVNISKSYAPISGYHRLVYLTFAFWCRI